MATSTIFAVHCNKTRVSVDDSAVLFESPPDQGLCLWTPLGALPPDPRYRLTLYALAMCPRKLPMAPLCSRLKYSGAGAVKDLCPSVEISYFY